MTMFFRNIQIQALVLLWASPVMLALSLPTDFSTTRYNPSSNDATKQQLVQLFQQWMKTHNKSYAQPAVKAHRFKNFVRNYEYVQDWNANREKGSHIVGLNQFSDLSAEEFKDKYMRKSTTLRGRRRRNEGDKNRGNNLTCSNVAPSLDWSKKGVVTPVKDQGYTCGSCYAFPSTGAIEGINAIRTGRLISLSEQEIIDCSKNNSGCSGGFVDFAFDWIIQNGGISTELAYPYTAKVGRCNTTKANNTAVTIDGYRVVPPNDEAILCAVQNQPITVDITTGGDDFAFYSGGIYDGNCSSNPDDADHVVLLVGYGSENGTDYWIVKNSWSTQWGVQGYMYIKRDKKLPYGKCGMYGYAYYPIKNHASFTPISSFWGICTLVFIFISEFLIII